MNRLSCRILKFAGVAAVSLPAVSFADEARVVLDKTNDLLLLSVNGSAYSPVGTLASTGWTRDAGGVVRLTTIGDAVGVGVAVPEANTKMQINADADAETALRVWNTATTTAPIAFFGRPGPGGATAYVDQVLKFATQHPTRTYNFAIDDVANASGDRNRVAYLGYNVTGAGTNEDAAEPSIAIGFESDFDTGATRVMESHLVYQNGASQRRVWSLTVNRATHAAELATRGRRVHSSSTGTTLLLFEESGFFSIQNVGASSHFHKVGNNTTILAGDDPGGASREILRIGADDALYIDVGQNFAGGTRVLSPSLEVHAGGTERFRVDATQTQVREAFGMGTVATSAVQSVAMGADINEQALNAQTNWLQLVVAGAVRTLHGISGGFDGRMVCVGNTSNTAGGAEDLVLPHESATCPTAGSRFRTPNNANYTVRNNGGTWLRYDGGISRWRLIDP